MENKNTDKMIDKLVYIILFPIALIYIYTMDLYFFIKGLITKKDKIYYLKSRFKIWRI